MIRRASTDDANSLLNIYSQYIDTPTTFEEELPTIEEFENRIRTIQDVYPY
jgi:L-amino acid N-acyltransferase YncA